MAQPKRNPEASIPHGKNADILPFKARQGAEELDPSELSDAECISFFVHRWNHPGFGEEPLADLINTDIAGNEDIDAWQERLQGIVDDSPLFDYYDETLEADPIIRLLDSTMRSTIPSRTDTRSHERKAMRHLMYIRGSEVIEHPDQAIGPQLKRLPLGDEPMWVKLIERLAKEA